MVGEEGCMKKVLLYISPGCATFSIGLYVSVVNYYVATTFLCVVNLIHT